MSISPILSSSSASSIMSSVAERLGVSSQDPRVARSKGAGSGCHDAGLVLLEAGVEESVTLVPGRAVLAAAGLQVAAVAGLQETVWVLEVTDLKLEHPDSAHNLRLYRERDEKYHSALQGEVSPVPPGPPVWPSVDLSAPVSGMEPTYPVRSRALHPCVRGLETVLCALEISVPPPPPSLRPPSAELSFSPILNPETPVKPLHRVQVGESLALHVSAWIYHLNCPANPQERTPDHTLCYCARDRFPQGMAPAHNHARTSHKHSPFALCSFHHLP